VLEEIRIQGLGVIDDAVLPLSRGLTVLTGETGAGKTMVVQGLALLFGGRADSGRIRPGADRALVEGRLLLAEDHPAALRAREAGAEAEEGVLLVARSVGADGRSRAHLAGRAVPISVLSEVGEDVLALHGQSDQQRLLQPQRQREALDRFGGAALLAAREDFAGGWAELREVRLELATLRAEVAERVREAELLRLGLAEVEAVAPQPAEDLELRADIERLSHAEALGGAARAALAAVTGAEDGAEHGVEHGAGEGAHSLLSAAHRALESVVGHDPAVAELAGRTASLVHEVADLGHEVASYLASAEVDPARLARQQERLAVLSALIRRHGTADVDGVLSWAQEAGTRLLTLDATEDVLAALLAREAALLARLGALATTLSQARCEAAGRFSTAVTAELQQLAMPHAQVQAVVAQRPDEQGLPVGGQLLHAGPHGVDDVELVLVPHPGAPARPLAKGASGGELSRIMLAVEVVFAGADPVPLMVFDEVDAGVGGAAAVEIGRRLARLAASHQVVVVTHLPQVAAFAHQHLRVRKHTDGESLTRGDVEVLVGEERVSELSRMLAGSDSGVARAHAEELLQAAAADREPTPGS
jgi:DNA repair protein RecN (Recombination protein N)